MAKRGCGWLRNGSRIWWCWTCFLPKLSGPEVLRALRKDGETASIPVMVLTSLSPCDEHKLIKEGATSYFAKSELMLDKGATLFVDAVERMLLKARAKAAGC